MEEINSKKNHKIGSITVITGNMFSGKTGLLIAKYNQNKNYRKCLAFKPTLDTRYSETEIVSHDQESIKAIPITTIQEIDKYKERFDSAYIDELHFFSRNDQGGEVNRYLNELANQNKEIVGAGLTWDCFADKPFLSVAHLVATAEYPPVSKPNINKDKNALIIIAGGSGTGKTTIENLLAQSPNITKLVSTTTRPPRAGEVDGQDYYFISKAEFEVELAKGRFLEHVIYDGNYYGVHGKVIDLILGTQKKNGAESREKMIEHMKKRGTSEPEIIRRLIIEEKEGKFAVEFDYILTVKENGLAEVVRTIKNKLNYEMN
ncbi:1218_t:CDS:2 [Funneliformis geosporum]|nr:1218_t:CDS:2 [Funneliformis geosporum]